MQSQSSAVTQSSRAPRPHPTDPEAALIPLTRGKVAIVDRADLPTLAAFTWYADRKAHLYYATRRVGARKERMHRILLPAPPGLEVDHINGDSLDNRRANLRLVTHAQNLRNSRAHQDGSSGYRGVSWSRPMQAWRAEICVAGQDRYLGTYATPEEAARAYNRAARAAFGDFARLNPTPDGVDNPTYWRAWASIRQNRATEPTRRGRNL